MGRSNLSPIEPKCNRTSTLRATNILRACAVLMLLLIPLRCQAGDVNTISQMQVDPARQGLSLLLGYANAVDATSQEQGYLVGSLPKLERHVVTIQSLASVAKKSGLKVSVRRISLSRLAALRCVALACLKGSDRFVVVMAIGSKYALVWNNSGTDDYVETADLYSCYAGTAMILSNYTKPVVTVSEPIISEKSEGPMTYVSAVIGYRNISGRRIRITPQPCGCSGAPRGEVDRSELGPGETAHLTITSMTPQFDPFCLPLPLATDDSRCPVFYLGLMCLPPGNVVAHPSTMLITAPQFSESSGIGQVFLPSPYHLKSIVLAHPSNHLRLETNTERIDAPPSVPGGTVSNIRVVLLDNTPIGDISDDVVVSYDNGHGAHVFRYPCNTTVRSDAWVDPTELFLGVLKPGSEVHRTITVKSRSNRPLLITQASCAGDNAQINSPRNGGDTSVGVTITSPMTSSNYFRGSFKIVLSDGTVLSVPYSGMTSSD